MTPGQTPIQTAGTSTPDGVIRNHQVDRATLPEGPWDGRRYGYVPSPTLSIDPSVELHEEFDTELDPVTYQVLRSRFWNLNLDHSDTIKRASGSPLIVFMDDFNTSLLTENGDTIVCGPSIQYFTGHGDLEVKWTLENRSANPGIEDGDVFLQNDPYVGATHQMDTSTYTPLFWEGKLFCWVLNAAHVGDIGGVDPGGFCVNAPDMFHESTPVPPIKLARRGVMQSDVHDMFVRKSRTPDMIALQIRSQLAGLRVTKARMVEMLEEYGPRVVKGAMRQMIKETSEAVSRRLLQIPDGDWQETIFLSSVGPDDRATHRLVTRLRKEGDRLIFSNEGTDPQFFAANGTFSAWRSANICASACLLAYDQFYCAAGVADHMEFRPTPGTLNVCTFPGAVTPDTASIVSVYLASQVVSKMLLCGPEEVRQAANAAGGVSSPGWWVAFGLDRNGNFVADLTGDSLNGSIGAFPHRDGVDTGGAWWWPRSRSGNVEEWEAALPILYLYRREQIDSGGAGRWRGGNGAEIAVIAHKTSNVSAQIIASDPAINSSPGLAGGMPGHSGNFSMARQTSIAKELAEGRMPGDRAGLASMIGDVPRLSPKSNEALVESDVLCVEYSAGGGFGDSLSRPPQLVADDVGSGKITEMAARHGYGVCLADGAVDEAKTAALRQDLRSERLAASRSPASPAAKAVHVNQIRPVFGALGVGIESDRTSWACVPCGLDIGPTDQNFKLGAAIRDRNPAQIEGTVYPEPSDFCDDPFVMREYLCPECGSVLAVESTRSSDGPSHEISFTDRGLEMLRHANGGDV
jgi:N-methylhydantoinase B